MGVTLGRKRTESLSTLTLAIILAACGGGGGTAASGAGGSGNAGNSAAAASNFSLNGVAAVGAPLIGATVTSKCASGANQTATTSATGAWSLTISGSLPCAIQVANGTVNGAANARVLHSYAAASGLVNVTPLTDMGIALSSGKSSQNWFGSFAPAEVPDTAAAATRILAALGAANFTVPAGSFNPFSAVFSAQSGDAYDDLLEELNTALALAGQSYASLIAALAGTGAGAVAVPSSPLLRTTSFGPIEGVQDASSGAYAWLGIPYARPPVGNLRWTAPTDPVTWSSTRQTKQFGNACAQLGGLLGPQPAGKAWGLSMKDNWNVADGNEDCLTLNVWRPKTAETGLPVLVFIYGGSNIRGWSGTPDYNGARFAQEQKAVVVTMNYRTGYLGWINHVSLKTGDPKTDSGNFGTLDLIHSLKFVKNNIAAFGGDPNNVTIAGQSAGAVGVWSLIVSPAASNLFHKAAPMSGWNSGSTLAASQAASLTLLQKMLIRDGLATDAITATTYINSKTNAEIKAYLLGKSAAYISEMALPENGSVTGVAANIYDGTVLPPDVATAFTGSYLNNVPVLAGVTNEEGKWYLSPAATYVAGLNFPVLWTYKSNFDPDNPGAAPVALTDLIQSAYLPASAAFTLPCSNTGGYNGYAQYCGTLPTSLFWSLQTTTLNRMQPLQPKTYAYNFMWNQQPAPWNTFIGAAHVQDVAFMFGNFGTGIFSQGYSNANKPGREALSLMMRKSLHAFMMTGDPNNASLGTTWQAWSPVTNQPKRLELNATATAASAAMSINNNPTPMP